MNCQNCGKPLQENDNFCSECGHKIPAPQPQPTQTPPPQRPIGYCKNCGVEIMMNTPICTHCGVTTGTGINYCHHCGNQVDPMAAICLQCGCNLKQAPYFVTQKSKIVAGLFGIFLGGFGVHNFYLGYSDKAIIQLILTLVGIVLSCLVIGVFMILGSFIWGLVEGIMILAGSTSTDAKGVPLKE